MPETEAVTTVIPFGHCQLFTNRRELLVDGVPVPLGSRAFDVLQLLVDAGGDLVTKDEILSRVWPGIVVEENTLQVQITRVRRALGKDRGFLKTISGRGYRFVAEATSAAEECEGTAKAATTTETEALAYEREKRANLPAPTSPLLDRQAELSEVLRLVAAHRLVTLTGTGGIGKTRLALEVARHLQSELPDGAWLVELGPLTDPDLVSVTVATALPLMLPAGASPDDVAHLLGTKHLLIVLDNCEHVIEAAAPAAERLVRGTPAVRVLATSREPLRADGEQVYRVPGLNAPAKGTEDPDEMLRHGAVQLFVARARAAEPQFSTDGRVTVAMAEVCRRLDGIPLAIEFAAARAATLGVEKLAARLDDLFRLLTSGRRTALPRHQTLRATLDWSYEMLAKAERAVLRRVAVLPGPFMLEAACAVAADGEITADDVIDSISNLVSKSMIAATLSGAPVRHRLLETTRAYALEKLIGSDEFNPTARRHAEHYRAVFERAASEWETHSTDDWLAAYAGCIDNVRAALDWAWTTRGDPTLGVALTASVVPLWILLSLSDECRARVDQALANLDRASSRGTRDEMQLWFARAWSLHFNFKGPVPPTVAAWTNVLQMAEHLAHVDYQLRALWGLWACHLRRGEYPSALTLADRFAELAQGQSDPTDALVGESLRGVSLHLLGDQAGARYHLERMLAPYAPPARRSHIVRFQFNQQIAARVTLARTLWLQGLPDQALHLARSNVEDARTVDHGVSLPYALALGACPVALWAGDLSTAEHFVTLLLEVSTRPGFQAWNYWGRYFEGALAIRRGNGDSGLPLMRSALDALGARTNDLQYPAFMGEFAAALGMAGQVDQGLAAVEAALARSRRDSEHWCEPELLRIKGELRLLNCESGTTRAAQQLFSAGLECAHRQGALSWELRCATSLSRLWRNENRIQEAHLVLAPILARFGEGFATADLMTAKALLDELQETNPAETSSELRIARLRVLAASPPRSRR
jgi:predicted ATPase/DNA-binding winged helix-turn-helix (wHTH) protein